MNITLQYGDENNRESESKLSFFVWNGTHEKQVGLASKDESFDVQLVKGTYMKHPATSDMTIEIICTWVSTVRFSVECAAFFEPDDFIFNAINNENKARASKPMKTNTAASPFPFSPWQGIHFPCDVDAGAKLGEQREQRVLLLGGLAWPYAHASFSLSIMARSTVFSLSL